MDNNNSPQTLDTLPLLAERIPPDLRTEVLKYTLDHPDAKPLLTRLLAHFLEPKDQDCRSLPIPPSKKRKIKQEEDDEEADVKKDKAAAAAADVKDPLLCTVQSLSFTMPARRRFWLRVHASSLRLVTAQTEEPVATVLFDDIEHAFCVPSPERVKEHYSICLLKRGADSIQFGFEEAAHMLIAEPDGSLRPRAESGKTALLDVLQDLPCKIIEPDVRDLSFAKFFNRSIQYIPCHYKNKAGVLYFMPNGFFYGLKKPLIFVPFSEILGTKQLKAHGRVTLILMPREDSGRAPLEFEHMDGGCMSAISRYLARHGGRFGEGVRASSPHVHGSSSDDSDFDPGNENTRDSRLAEEYDSGHDTESNASSASEEEGEGDQADDPASDADDEEQDATEPNPPAAASPPDREVPRAYVQGVVDEVLADTLSQTAPRVKGMAAIAAQIDREHKAKLEAKVKVKREPV
ncbi:hypothetical protein HDU86_004227 [Geranomyces michiganensis]|nr:hypothetical protein HDU86_004227 [Geranomyces michiganensis]